MKRPCLKVKNRLEQLDDLEEGSVQETLSLTQQEYMKRIEVRPMLFHFRYCSHNSCVVYELDIFTSPCNQRETGIQMGLSQNSDTSEYGFVQENSVFFTLSSNCVLELLLLVSQVIEVRGALLELLLLGSQIRGAWLGLLLLDS